MRARKKTAGTTPHTCRECANVTVETKFRTLSVEGKPTLGRCPYWKDGKYCVLLRQKACSHYRHNDRLT